MALYFLLKTDGSYYEHPDYVTTIETDHKTKIEFVEVEENSLSDFMTYTAENNFAVHMVRSGLQDYIEFLLYFIYKK